MLTLESSRLLEKTAACGRYGPSFVLSWLEKRLPAPEGDESPVPATGTVADGQPMNRRPTYAEFRRARQEAGW